MDGKSQSVSQLFVVSAPRVSGSRDSRVLLSRMDVDLTKRFVQLLQYAEEDEVIQFCEETLLSEAFRGQWGVIWPNGTPMPLFSSPNIRSEVRRFLADGMHSLRTFGGVVIRRPRNIYAWMKEAYAQSERAVVGKTNPTNETNKNKTSRDPEANGNRKRVPDDNRPLLPFQVCLPGNGGAFRIVASSRNEGPRLAYSPPEEQDEERKRKNNGASKTSTRKNNNKEDQETAKRVTAGADAEDSDYLYYIFNRRRNITLPANAELSAVKASGITVQSIFWKLVQELAQVKTAERLAFDAANAAAHPVTYKVFPPPKTENLNTMSDRDLYGNNAPRSYPGFTPMIRGANMPPRTYWEEIDRKNTFRDAFQSIRAYETEAVEPARRAMGAGDIVYDPLGLTPKANLHELPLYAQFAPRPIRPKDLERTERFPYTIVRGGAPQILLQVEAYRQRYAETACRAFRIPYQLYTRRQTDPGNSRSAASTAFTQAIDSDLRKAVADEQQGMVELWDFAVGKTFGALFSLLWSDTEELRAIHPDPESALAARQAFQSLGMPPEQTSYQEKAQWQRQFFMTFAPLEPPVLPRLVLESVSVNSREALMGMLEVSVSHPDLISPDRVAIAARQYYGSTYTEQIREMQRHDEDRQQDEEKVVHNNATGSSKDTKPASRKRKRKRPDDSVEAEKLKKPRKESSSSSSSSSTKEKTT